MQKYGITAHTILLTGRMGSSDLPCTPLCCRKRSCSKSELREFLYSIIMELPEKQLKRFYAYYVLRMKLKDIARIEGTDAAAVLRSVQKSEKTIRKK